MDRNDYGAIAALVILIIASVLMILAGGFAV